MNTREKINELELEADSISAQISEKIKELEKRISVIQPDEEFNHMVKEIEELFKKLDETLKEKKEFEKEELGLGEKNSSNYK